MHYLGRLQRVLRSNYSEEIRVEEDRRGEQILVLDFAYESGRGTGQIGDDHHSARYAHSLPNSQRFYFTT